MIKQNLHTHSIYCDGNNTIEEMALEAIQKGFTVLGFQDMVIVDILIIILWMKKIHKNIYKMF